MKTLVAVTDKYVQCSLIVDIMSRCGRMADTGVVLEDGMVMWRCRDHEGWTAMAKAGEPQDYGHVVTKVAMK